MPALINFQAFTLAGGIVYTLLAIIIWTMLRGRPGPLSTTLWSLGSLAAGLSVVLLAARDRIPDWASYQVANALSFGAYVVRVQALRVDLQRIPHWRAGLLIWLASVAAYQWGMTHGGPVWRVGGTVAVNMLGTLTLAYHARALGRAENSRSGLLLAWVETAFAIGLFIRAVAIATGASAPVPIGQSWDFALLALLGLVAGLYGNLGYLGMALDRARSQQSRAGTAELTERLRREVAERSAVELRALLGQRDRLATERDRLLRVLAHEIRQPLHNASGALQSAAHELHTRDGGDHPAASTRLLRAQAVLGDVRSVLDNTLTASEMLTRMAPLSRDEVDIDVLIELTLGDLPEPQRARVSVQRHTPVRMMELDPGLVRVALRNLLRNAFIHGGSEVQVVVSIGETASPPALVLGVEDDGIGMTHPQALGLATPDAVLDWPEDQRGLGLFIVRRVMALHGGRLMLNPSVPHGLSARLVFPDPMPEDGGQGPD